MTTAIHRKPWSNKETDTLIRVWEDVGSIILLSILLNRSTSSVQTQASRIGLPRRSEQLQRHRRRWSRAEEKKLEALLEEYSTPAGRIRIFEVADAMTRSVDAIAAKLIEKLGDEAALIEKIDIPNHIKRKLDNPKLVDAVEKVYKKPGEIVDTRRSAKRRNCLTCGSPFWSEGAHNRICDKCSSAHENDEAFGNW